MNEVVTKYSEDLFASVKGYLGLKFAPIVARLDALEKRQPEKGEKGDPGLNGESIRGEKGDPGERGADGIGLKGEKGDRGERGADGIGLKGEKGDRGEKGDPGESIKGDPGERGERGADGLSIKGDPGEKGEPGTNGKDGAAGLDGKDGADGLNGKDADPEVIKAMATELASAIFQKAVVDMRETMATEIATIRRESLDFISAQVKALPPATPGKDADPEVLLRMVKDAVGLVPVPKDGQDGRDAPTLEEIIPAVVAILPTPKDGAAGRDAPTIEDLREVIRGEVAIAAKDIPPGRDGRDAEGAPGKDGKDGRDGLSIEDLEFSFKGDRTLVVEFKRTDGEIIRKEGELEGFVVYQGPYRAGQYAKGDAITFGGSIWIAKRQTDTAPPGDDWRLAVKGTR